MGTMQARSLTLAERSALNPAVSKPKLKPQRDRNVDRTGAVERRQIAGRTSALAPYGNLDPSFYRHIFQLKFDSSTVGGPLMGNDTQYACRFGAHDRPLCENCGNRTFLSRRSPAAAWALQLERQTFTCLECDQDFERVVDENGKSSTAIESVLA